MKKIVFTLAAIMTIGASLAQAEGANRNIYGTQQLDCTVTLDNRAEISIISPISQLNVTTRKVGPKQDPTTITVRQASGHVIVTAFRGSQADVVHDQLSQGYMSGKSGNLKVSCVVH
jgi:hypothetical protein